MKRAAPAVPLLALLASCAALRPSAPLQLAITVDDLPVHGEFPPGETVQGVARSMIAALRAGGASDAHGFINGHWTVREPATREVLADWRAGGLPLGNHTWSHRHLSEMTVEEFERDVARNEPLLEQLGGDWRWLRYPFLDEGKDPAQRQAARDLLAKRGYRIAAVTMDFSDWQWTAPYARCKAAGDEAAIHRMERMFLDSARENIGFSRELSRKLHGRDIPYVLLLHASAFEARILPQLLHLYRAHGFRFIGLAEAQRDPAYADQIDPRLPAEPRGLEGKADDRGIALPARTDYAPLLEAMCRPASAPPPSASRPGARPNSARQRW